MSLFSVESKIKQAEAAIALGDIDYFKAMLGSFSYAYPRLYPLYAGFNKISYDHTVAHIVYEVARDIQKFVPREPVVLVSHKIDRQNLRLAITNSITKHSDRLIPNLKRALRLGPEGEQYYCIQEQLFFIEATRDKQATYVLTLVNGKLKAIQNAISHPDKKLTGILNKFISSTRLEVSAQEELLRRQTQLIESEYNAALVDYAKFLKTWLNRIRKSNEIGIITASYRARLGLSVEDYLHLPIPEIVEQLLDPAHALSPNTKCSGTSFLSLAVLNPDPTLSGHQMPKFLSYLLGANASPLQNDDNGACPYYHFCNSSQRALLDDWLDQQYQNPLDPIIKWLTDASPYAENYKLRLDFRKKIRLYNEIKEALLTTLFNFLFGNRTLLETEQHILNRMMTAYRMAHVTGQDEEFITKIREETQLLLEQPSLNREGTFLLVTFQSLLSQWEIESYGIKRPAAAPGATIYSREDVPPPPIPDESIPPSYPHPIEPIEDAISPSISNESILSSYTYPIDSIEDTLSPSEDSDEEDEAIFYDAAEELDQEFPSLLEGSKNGADDAIIIGVAAPDLHKLRTSSIPTVT